MTRKLIRAGEGGADARTDGTFLYVARQLRMRLERMRDLIGQGPAGRQQAFDELRCAWEHHERHHRRVIRQVSGRELTAELLGITPPDAPPGGCTDEELQGYTIIGLYFDFAGDWNLMVAAARQRESRYSGPDITQGEG